MGNEQKNLAQEQGGFVGGIDFQLQRGISSPDAQDSCCGSTGGTPSAGCCGEVATVVTSGPDTKDTGGCCGKSSAEISAGCCA